MEAIAISLFLLVIPSTKHTTNWARLNKEKDNLRCNTPSKRILVTLQLTSRLKSIYHIFGKIKGADDTIPIDLTLLQLKPSQSTFILPPPPKYFPSMICDDTI